MRIIFIHCIYPKLEIRGLAFVEVTSKYSVTGTNACPLISLDIRISMISTIGIYSILVTQDFNIKHTKNVVKNNVEK